MDAKDKYIIWCLSALIGYILGIRGYGLIIEVCITGIIIKIIDAHFTQIVFWVREHFNIDSRQ